MTQPEILLWSRLKGRGSDKPIFRRQFAYGTMVFDFYCPAAQLAVEIDGAAHWDEAKRGQDQARDIWLARRGIAVLRIGAHAVFSDLGRVADGVILRAEERMAAETPRSRLALSTARSAASGPPIP